LSAIGADTSTARDARRTRTKTQPHCDPGSTTDKRSSDLKLKQGRPSRWPGSPGTASTRELFESFGTSGSARLAPMIGPIWRMPWISRTAI